jgi:hypothetical protein
LSASGEILVSSTSIASLSLNGGSLSADSLRFDVTGAAFAGSLDISGSISALSLTNGIIIDLSNWSGDATLLAPITLLTYDDAATEHLSVSLNYGANAGLLNVSHTWNAGALSLMVAPVPEPATTAALLALLTLTLLLRRRQT